MPQTTVVMRPLYAACPDCRQRPVYRTRQRQMGRTFQPKWCQSCHAHAPANGTWHQTEYLDPTHADVKVL